MSWVYCVLNLVLGGQSGEARIEWPNRFGSRHLVFGSLKGIGLCHLQNIITTDLVDELDLLCIKLVFRWTIQESKN